MHIIKSQERNVFKNIDVLVLAGGKATRINNLLIDVPKLLAPIAGKTFFDFLIDWLQSFNIRRIILCLGHLSEKVQDHILKTKYPGISIDVSIEKEPLGTAGAIKHAKQFIKNKTILVVNGDTLIDTDLIKFVKEHNNCGLDASILCTNVNDVSRYGSVEIGNNGSILSYSEKKKSGFGPGNISAGIYLFSENSINSLMKVGGPSLEHDFLQLLPASTVHGYTANNVLFVDIGTPESYKKATTILPNFQSLRENIL